MTRPIQNNVTPATREEPNEKLMQQLRPKVEEVVRKLVERAVDVPEHEEFGAIEFRDAGLNLANDVRQATVASWKKGVARGNKWQGSVWSLRVGQVAAAGTYHMVDWQVGIGLGGKCLWGRRTDWRFQVFASPGPLHTIPVCYLRPYQ